MESYKKAVKFLVPLKAELAEILLASQEYVC
jgi:hypothetical protein